MLVRATLMRQDLLKRWRDRTKKRQHSRRKVERPAKRRTACRRSPLRRVTGREGSVKTFRTKRQNRPTSIRRHWQHRRGAPLSKLSTGAHPTPRPRRPAPVPSPGSFRGARAPSQSSSRPSASCGQAQATPTAPCRDRGTRDAPDLGSTPCRTGPVCRRTRGAWGSCGRCRRRRRGSSLSGEDARSRGVRGWCGEGCACVARARES